jgi:hypothetical protein
LPSAIRHSQTELVVFGWDFGNPRFRLSVEDACSLANAADACPGFFFTPPESREAFLTGTLSDPEALPASNPIVESPLSKEILDRAKEKRSIPSGWSDRKPLPRGLQFGKFAGEPVELFTYLPDAWRRRMAC